MYLSVWQTLPVGVATLEFQTIALELAKSLAPSRLPFLFVCHQVTCVVHRAKQSSVRYGGTNTFKHLYIEFGKQKQLEYHVADAKQQITQRHSAGRSTAY